MAGRRCRRGRVLSLFQLVDEVGDGDDEDGCQRQHHHAGQPQRAPPVVDVAHLPPAPRLAQG